jgi:acyl-coenzyme A thioesterase PaaI-like protein
MPNDLPLQERLHPECPIRACYGCGADNAHGLKIKSFLQGDEGVCRWRPEPHHCSYPGFLNGGIACTLIDCHSAWTALALESREKGFEIESGPEIPTGWTRAMHIEFLKPVPLTEEVVLRAKVIKSGRTSRTVACSVYCNGAECVKGEVTMVMAGA